MLTVQDDCEELIAPDGYQPISRGGDAVQGRAGGGSSVERVDAQNVNGGMSGWIASTRFRTENKMIAQDDCVELIDLDGYQPIAAGGDAVQCGAGGGGADGGSHVQDLWNKEVFSMWNRSRMNWRQTNGVEEFEMEDDGQGQVYSPKGGSGEEIEKLQTREKLRMRRRLDNAW